MSAFARVMSLGEVGLQGFPGELGDGASLAAGSFVGGTAQLLGDFGTRDEARYRSSQSKMGGPDRAASGRPRQSAQRARCSAGSHL